MARAGDLDDLEAGVRSRFFGEMIRDEGRHDLILRSREMDLRDPAHRPRNRHRIERAVERTRVMVLVHGFGIQVPRHGTDRTDIGTPCRDQDRHRPAAGIADELHARRGRLFHEGIHGHIHRPDHFPGKPRGRPIREVTGRIPVVRGVLAGPGQINNVRRRVPHRQLESKRLPRRRIPRHAVPGHEGVAVALDVDPDRVTRPFEFLISRQDKGRGADGQLCESVLPRKEVRRFTAFGGGRHREAAGKKKRGANTHELFFHGMDKYPAENT